MTREDLKDYKYNQEWIKGRLEYIEEYRSTLDKITTTLSDMPKGSRAIEDSMAEKLAILLDNIDEIMKVVLKESEKQKRILEQLDKVEQPYKLVLEKVYIQGKSLVTVASELGYSYVHICREHGTALNKFDNVI